MHTNTNTEMEKIIRLICSTAAKVSPVERKWLFTSEKLDKVQCCQHLSKAEILKKRQTTAELIQSIGKEIDVDQSCINTACVYMHRFYASKCFCTFNSATISKAAIFLAAKRELTSKTVHEEQELLSKVVEACYYICHPCWLKGSTIPDLKYLKDDLINFVELLFETLDHHLSIELPDKIIKEYADDIKLPPSILEQCLRLSTTCIQLTTFYLEYTPHIIGSFCVWSVLKWLSRDVLASENPNTNHYKEIFTTMMVQLLKNRPKNALKIRAFLKKKRTAKMSDVSDTLELDLFPSSTTQSK